MSLLAVEGLTMRYGTGRRATEAILGLSFSVDEGEFLCVIGPSGCGKSTLLRCTAGLLAPTAGSVRLRGEPVTEPPAGMAFVFQEYDRSLFPWMTVRQNVAFPLRTRGLTQAERDERTEEAVDAVDLSGFLDHHPWELSGGMQQRVAIARALAYRPELLLMDEPFASVDAQTRAELEDLTLRVTERVGVTTVFVTHDLDEAIYLADRILVLTPRPGRLRASVTVDLPRPRDQLRTRGLSAFAQLRARVHGALGAPS